MRKELKKVDEYKENMYFEAVQDILTKVNDPKTKGSTKVCLVLFFPKCLPSNFHCVLSLTAFCLLTNLALYMQTVMYHQNY